MNIPACRDQLGEWLNANGLLGTGVEVGALSAVYSAIVLRQWHGQRLWLIDPWEKQPLDVYLEDDGRFNHEDAYRRAKLFAEQEPRAILLKGLSPDLADNFSNGTLDFVYIDGNHRFAAVRDDLNAWWPKIRPGGIMGGHDCYNSLIPNPWCEVERAVKEWSAEQSVPFEVTQSCTSWWAPKPK